MEPRLLIVSLLHSKYPSVESFLAGSWAHLLYLLALASVVIAIMKWNSKKINTKAKALEALVELSREQLNQSIKSEKLIREKVLKLTTELEASHKNLLRCNDELSMTKKDLEQAHHQLVESEKMASLGQLTAGIAHEINNPINFISGGVQALEVLHREILERRRLAGEDMDPAREDLRSLMKSINNGVSRTATIIKSLKTFSSPVETIDDSGRMDVKECAENAVTLVGSKLIENSIRVQKNFMHRSGAFGNPSQLCQVLINILDNSIYALSKIRRERLIVVETMDSGENVIVKIKDNGTGIPKEIQDRIFDAFFTTKEVGSGTGLGLSICQSIIQRHKGKISFVSSEGLGTEFIITLPKGEQIQIW